MRVNLIELAVAFILRTVVAAGVSAFTKIVLGVLGLNFSLIFRMV
jgi:hypothetical protein